MTAAVEVSVRGHADHTVVAANGRLYFDTDQPLRDTLRALSSSPAPHLVLDLSGVPLCDSSGLNLLAQTHRQAASQGGWLRLVAPQPHVRRALEITNLTRMLRVYPTVDDATRDTAT
jgi:anti-sigma B factor antagonist